MIKKQENCTRRQTAGAGRVLSTYSNDRGNEVKIRDNKTRRERRCEILLNKIARTVARQQSYSWMTRLRF